MIILEEYQLKMEQFKKDITELGKSIKLDEMKARLSELEEISGKADFWEDPENSQKILVEQKFINEKINRYNKLLQDFEDCQTLIEIAGEENDNSFDKDIVNDTAAIEAEINKQTLETLLNEEYDKNNAILSFHAGAGGTEAQDWALMLFRMYSRYAEQNKFKVTVLDYLDGDEAGMKSGVLLIEGQNAYGYLKSEAGVHRLVRISPFDASGRRHTSFASVEVMPEIDDTVNIVINEEDIRIDTHRASGAGGQHVNKTDSAIRITHLPTGIVVSCQNERSQKQNKETAIKLLKSKLIEIKEREHLDKIEDIKGEQKDIAWGSQIRSYVFMPYTMVKDHRTNFETGNVNAVMDGDIGGFIDAYLKFKKGIL